MKHIRSLEADQPLDETPQKRAAAKALSIDERDAGPSFFHGLVIALVISLSAYLALFLVYF